VRAHASRCAASGPPLLHQLQPLTKPLKERNLQFRASPTGHDRGVSSTVNCEHVPRPSDQLARDRMGWVGQSSMVNALRFPESERVESAKDNFPYCFRADVTYWQDSGCHCENTGTTPSFLCSSSRSFPFWIACKKSGNGWILVRSYEHIARDRMYNGKLRKCEMLGVKPQSDSWSGIV